MAVAVIITAAGVGKRFGTRHRKPFVRLGRQPILAWSLTACERTAGVAEVVLVVHPDDLARSRRLVARARCRKVRAIVPGGATRADSVYAGLQAVSPDVTVVAVHDAARPLVTPDLIGRVVATAARHGAALAATPMVPTTKLVDARGRVIRTLDRRRLWGAQTPQAFRRKLLEAAYRAIRGRARQRATDEAMLVELYGVKSRIVEDTPRNLKITTQDDLAIAQALVGR